MLKSGFLNFLFRSLNFKMLTAKLFIGILLSLKPASVADFNFALRTAETALLDTPNLIFFNPTASTLKMLKSVTL